MPSMVAVSVDIGRWGPCCSVAPTGSTAIRRERSRRENSSLVRSDQKRLRRRGGFIGADLSCGMASLNYPYGQKRGLGGYPVSAINIERSCARTRLSEANFERSVKNQRWTM